MFDLTSFINSFVTHRDESMFYKDVLDNSNDLIKTIEDKSILVIGGAGSIGYSFIRAILPFHPSELVIVDTNENALTELTRSLRSSNTYADLVPDTYLPYPMDYSKKIWNGNLEYEDFEFLFQDLYLDTFLRENLGIKGKIRQSLNTL